MNSGHARFATITALLAVFPQLASPATAQCPGWNPILDSLGPNGFVSCLAVFDDGAGPALYVGGSFTAVGGAPIGGVARWNGSSWSALGSGVAGSYATVCALQVFDDGSGPALFAGGDFTTAGGQPADGLAKWDGSSWSGMGVGGLLPNAHVRSLAVFDDGTGPGLYVGGQLRVLGPAGICSNIARWDGTSWTALGLGVYGGTIPETLWVHSLATFDDGSGPALYAGGQFANAGAGPAAFIARWDGTGWSPVGSGLTAPVFHLVTLDDGSGEKLYVSGLFPTAGSQPTNGLATWDGVNWNPLPGELWSFPLLPLDDGTGSRLYNHHLAKWDGTAWIAHPNPPHRIADAVAFDDGTGTSLFVGGYASAAGGTPSFFAQWRGCPSPGQPLCFGDGSGAPCPCGNTGATGRGCENSASTGGSRLDAVGWPGIFSDGLRLSAVGVKPGARYILLQGDIEIAPTVFGDGLRCAGGRLIRLFVGVAQGGAATRPSGNDLSISVRSASAGAPIGPGSRRTYQLVHRDASASFCPDPQGGSWNASNAVGVDWLP